MSRCSFLAVLAWGWIGTFVCVMAYWTYGESLQPGQQYADPFLPCAFIACLGAPVVALVVGLILLATQVGGGE